MWFKQELWILNREHISLSDEANCHWLMMVLDEFSNCLQEQGEMKVEKKQLQISGDKQILWVGSGTFQNQQKLV